MVYESSTRRIYSSAPRPVISTSYSYSTPSARTYSYTVPDTTGSTTRRVETVTRTVRSSDSALGGPAGRSYSTTTESTSRDEGYGPRTSTFTSERSIGGPGGASYFSTASYKSPYVGNSFRHMSYK